MPDPTPLLSIIVPFFNEERNLEPLFAKLRAVAESLPRYRFEFIFVNDGSADRSSEVAERLARSDHRLRLVEFSRNFGKEAATTAGLRESQGDAVLLLDADLQHPPERIPDFVAAWEGGADIAIGVRNASKSEGAIRRLGSTLFYAILNRISETDIVPRATDFRLLDRAVVLEFNRLGEHNRLTRGLIDWLGFRRALIPFDARERASGAPSYRIGRLVELAITSFVAHSVFPLRLAGYVGVAITIVAGALGTVELWDRFLAAPVFSFSGPAILATILLFLVGIVLVSIGLLSFYIGHIFHETQNRPLYIIRKKRS